MKRQRKTGKTPNVYAALVHYPTFNRRREVVTTAVTTVDIHDIARCCRTYGIKRFFVVTPISAQQELISRIVSHWTDGSGATVDHPRKEAMLLVEICGTIEEAVKAIKGMSGKSPKTIVTSAQNKNRTGITDFAAMRAAIEEDENPFLLIFGTGWGLADEVSSAADYKLEALAPESDYNHLSVRTAAAIIIDRLMGAS